MTLIPVSSVEEMNLSLTCGCNIFKIKSLNNWPAIFYMLRMNRVVARLCTPRQPLSPPPLKKPKTKAKTIDWLIDWCLTSSEQTNKQTNKQTKSNILHSDSLLKLYLISLCTTIILFSNTQILLIKLITSFLRICRKNVIKRIVLKYSNVNLAW